MTPLPRVLAFTDDRVATLDDLGIRAAAIAATGPAAGLVARWPHGSADQLTALAQRFVALAAPPMASVFVTGRVDIALVAGANGVILRSGDLPVGEVRKLVAGEIPRERARSATVFRSVHSLAEAQEAAGAEPPDALIAGMIWPSETHPERAAAGTTLLRDIVGLGLPVYAIGGVTPERAREARGAGAWGVAVIRTVWDAERPYQAVRGLVETWA